MLLYKYGLNLDKWLKYLRCSSDNFKVLFWNGERTQFTYTVQLKTLKLSNSIIMMKCNSQKIIMSNLTGLDLYFHSQRINWFNTGIYRSASEIFGNIIGVFGVPIMFRKQLYEVPFPPLSAAHKKNSKIVDRSSKKLILWQ